MYIIEAVSVPWSDVLRCCRKVAQRDTTFLCKICPVFHLLMLTAVLYSTDTRSLQLSTSGGNGRGNAMLLSTPSQCWQQTVPEVSWLAQNREKSSSDPHQPALPIVSLKKSPRVTDTTTCEHQPYPVLLFSIEQWQWLHHLICFSQLWLCCLSSLFMFLVNPVSFTLLLCLVWNFLLCNLTRSISMLQLIFLYQWQIFFSTDDVIIQDIALELPTNVLEGSARASFSVVGKYIINKPFLKKKI